MKKLLLLLMVLPFIFSSCSDDDDEKELDSLNGTTWVSKSYRDGAKDPYYIVTIKFKETSYSITTEEDGEEYTANGTYIFNKPNVLFTESDGGHTWKCVVEGNKLIEINEDDFVYIKQ